MLSMLAFIILGLIVLTGAINCVSSRNVIHGAYWLLLTAVGTAGTTWFLGAEYLAITQLLIYAGAVGILTVFTVMVTARSYESSEREVKLSWSALILSGGFFALVVYGITQTPALASFTTTVEPLALSQFGAYMFDIDGQAFAFEIASLVLLIALVAAVWWTKDKDDDEDNPLTYPQLGSELPEPALSEDMGALVMESDSTNPQAEEDAHVS
ncbi:MAG: NADH-quinone oxidoreductase subunit J [Coriobacteriia bacterium]|nr:NADH-quinone oxidoreductase subunit J [Coriobacteriia bacterium]